MEGQLLGRKRLEQEVRRIRTHIAQFVPLTAPLTSTAWDGDARSTAAKTLLDLPTVFGVPAGARAILAEVWCRDSASSGTTFRGVILGPTNTADEGIVTSCTGLSNDAVSYNNVVVPCTADGDIYYQTEASGAGTLDVWIQIWGYWL